MRQDVGKRSCGAQEAGFLHGNCTILVKNILLLHFAPVYRFTRPAMPTDDPRAESGPRLDLRQVSGLF
jgi:hypothetical protein